MTSQKDINPRFLKGAYMRNQVMGHSIPNKYLAWLGVLLWLFFAVSLRAFGAEVPILQDGKPQMASEVEEESLLRPVSSPRSKALDLQYSPMTFPNYAFSSTQRLEKMGGAVRLGMEWLPIQTIGKIGVGGSAGFFAASDTPTGPDRVATVYALPLETYLSYHFDYVPDQLLVPYARVGLNLSLAWQGSRTGGMTVPGTQTFYGWSYAFGVQLHLNNIDPSAAKKLDKSVGINSTYLIAEWTKCDFLDLHRAPDLTYNAFRVGLRFEM